MKLILIACLSIVGHIQFIIPQSDSPKIFHPLSNAFAITLELGGTLPKTDYKINELDIYGRILTEYYFTSRSIHAFGLRLFAGGGFINGEVYSNEPVYPPVSDTYRTGLFFAGAGLIYAIKVGNGVPYISATAGYLAFDPGDKAGNQLPGNTFSLYKKESLLYSGELGIRFPFSNIWSLNLGLNINFTGTDYIDDIKTGSNNDAFMSFFTGVSLYIGKSTYIDNDGIDDDVDLCLDTAEGETVDEFGCSISPKTYDNYLYDISNDKFITNGIFTDGNLICLQVDIFQEIKTAKDLQREINSLGYQAFIFNIKLNNLIWYSVRIGYFDSLNDARIFREIFFKKTGLKLK